MKTNRSPCKALFAYLANKLVLVLPLFFVPESKAIEATPYIVNGNQANLSDYPSFASLYYDDGNRYGYICGATIINSEYILTAAHCIYDEADDNLHTWVVYPLVDKGQYLTYQHQAARVKAFYFPDDYEHLRSKGWPNDIAIIQLESGLNVGDYQYLLNSAENDTYARNKGSDSFKAVGHGLIEGNQPSNGRLLETSLLLIDKSVCNSTDKQLCFDGTKVGAYKNSVCKGDSGGPVYSWDGNQYRQIGVTSYGLKQCGLSTKPAVAVFTEIYDYNPWINRVISGGQAAKYYVTTDRHGNRQYVDTTARKGGNGPRAPEIPKQTPESSESGGSLGIVILALLVFVGWRRTNKRATKVENISGPRQKYSRSYIM